MKIQRGPSYVLEGFIVSENVEVKELENIDTQFEYTDHQPVRMEAVLIQ